jgi:hypothetical protein
VGAWHLEHRPKERGLVLDGHEPPEHPDERHLSAKSERAAQDAASAVDREVGLEVNPDRDHLILPPTAHTQLEELVANLLAHGHEDVGPAREGTLEADERLACGAGEVALENVAVKGVDGSRPEACRKRCETAWAMCVWTIAGRSSAMSRLVAT